MHELKTVIWDFNGTILDDLELVVRTINTLLRARDLDTTTVELHRRHFAFPVQAYYEHLGFNLEQEDFGVVSREYHDHYLAGIAECSIHDGAKELLDMLREQGVRQFVLSAMQQQLLEKALGDLGVADYFEAIYGLDDLMARSKVERGNALLAGHAVEPGSALYIGDTDHDVEVAHALGCRCVGVGVGHQAPERFNPAHAHVARDFRELSESFSSSGSQRRVLFSPPHNGA